jgi:hypothetical protein
MCTLVEELIAVPTLGVLVLLHACLCIGHVGYWLEQQNTDQGTRDEAAENMAKYSRSRSRSGYVE